MSQSLPSLTIPGLLTLSPLNDRVGRPILLLHTAHFPSPSTPVSALATHIRPTLAHLPPAGGLTLVLCHAGHAAKYDSTTRAGVRAVRTAYDSDQLVPPSLRARLEDIVLLHVSFRTRAHIYLSSFSMPGREYDKITYCDLLADLENHLGVESTLLGLEKVDFDYDDTMRTWVGRQDEHKPVTHPDPKKPLLDLANVSSDWSSDPLPAAVEQAEENRNLRAQP